MAVTSRCKFTALLLAFIAAGCATSHAPRNWLQHPLRQQFLACGAWAEVKTDIDSVQQKADGELLAVTDDSLFLVTSFGVTSYARTEITAVTLAHYAPQHQLLAGWATVGALSTISHGFYLVGSLPLWIITGVTATGVAAGEPIVSYQPNEKKPRRNKRIQREEDTIEEEWQQMIRYARFPQGIPAAVDRSQIQMFEPPPTPPTR